MLRPVAALFLLLALAACSAGAAAVDPAAARPAPEFTHAAVADWLNSAPLTMKGLRGQVVVLDVWTFG